MSLTCSLLVVLVSGLLPSMQEKSEQFRITVNSANVRTQPSTSGQVIISVPRDTVLTVLAPVGDWLKVEITDRSGMTRAGYILGSLGRREMKPDLAKKTPGPGTTIANTPTKEPRTAIPTPTSPPTTDAPEPQNTPSVGKDSPRRADEPGSFGVGAQIGINPTGLEPSVLYDVNKKFTIRGLFDFGSGYSLVGGQLLYRFGAIQAQPDTNTIFTPFVGGGVFVINVNYGGLLGDSQSFTGFLGSGGVFIALKNVPRWRFSGELVLPVFSYGQFGQPAVSGLYLAGGAHYFF